MRACSFEKLGFACTLGVCYRGKLTSLSYVLSPPLFSFSRRRAERRTRQCAFLDVSHTLGGTRGASHLKPVGCWVGAPYLQQVELRSGVVR